MSKTNYPILNYRYQLLKELGSGNTAQVFLASDLQNPGQLFAIKIVTEKWLAGSANSTEIFLAEANVSARLSQYGNESLVQVYGFGTNGCLSRSSDNMYMGNIHYLIMEYVLKGMLFDYVKEQGALGEDTTRYFAH